MNNLTPHLNATMQRLTKAYSTPVMKDQQQIEKHECEVCGELNTITRDIKDQIVPEDCAFCN